MTTYSPKPEELTGNICVFAGSVSGKFEYSIDAWRLGTLIALQGYGLVYGGVNSAGLMKDVSTGASLNGAPVIGVLPGLRESDRLHGDGRTRTIHTLGLQARKLKMLELSDGVVALPGGFGTLDELATTIEIGRGSARSRAVSRLAILNTSGYYDGLKMQLERMRHDGMITANADEVAYFARTPDEAVEFIDSSIAKARSLNNGR